MVVSAWVLASSCADRPSEKDDYVVLHWDNEDAVQ